MFWQELRFEWYRSVFLLLTIFWIYELKSSKGKGFNDEDVNILTETSVYSEPFQFCPTINLLNLHVITFEFYH